jgi:hypothetical protein
VDRRTARIPGNRARARAIKIWVSERGIKILLEVWVNIAELKSLVKASD